MTQYKRTEFPEVHDSECETRIASPEELSAYLDKELPPWKCHLIRRHLKKCKVCADRLHRLERTDAFLRHAGDVEVPVAFLSGVMMRISTAAEHQRREESLCARIGQFVKASSGWANPILTFTGKLRYNIRTRSPVYIFMLTFAVFTMIGVTLYTPSDHKLVKEMHQLDTEKLISFEVIQPEPPKRLLTVDFQPR